MSIIAGIWHECNSIERLQLVIGFAITKGRASWKFGSDA